MTRYHETIWSPPRPINNRWIRIVLKDGKRHSFNADYIECVEYIEDK